MAFNELMLATEALCADLASLRFSEPVTHVYNPLLYAKAGYTEFLRRYASGPKRAIFLGMNPGPWGMAQTGIPFGEVTVVRDWFQIDMPIGSPEREHHKRPVTGLACRRNEVSGKRFWGAMAEIFGSPDAFFERYFVLNYCPLLFLEESGRNRTPDKLPASERAAIYSVCDRHLLRVIEILRPQWLIGIGTFAEERASMTLAGTGVRIGRVLHPSPANPATNRGWLTVAAQELDALGLWPM